MFPHRVGFGAIGALALAPFSTVGASFAWVAAEASIGFASIEEVRALPLKDAVIEKGLGDNAGRLPGPGTR